MRHAPILLFMLLLAYQPAAQSIAPEQIDHYLAEQQYLEITRLLHVAIEQNPVDATTAFLYYYQGKAYSQLYFQNAAALDVEDQQAYLELESVLDTARQAFTKCLSIASADYAKKCLKQLEGMSIFMKEVSRQYYKQGHFERFYLNIQRARSCDELNYRAAPEQYTCFAKSELVYLAIYACQLTDRKEEVRTLYQELQKEGIRQEEMYQQFVYMYLDLGEVNRALGTIFQGRNKFPYSTVLLYQELDLYVQLGYPEKVISRIDESLEDFGAEQAQLFFIRGNACEEMYGKLLKTKTELAERHYLEAENAYLQAIELAPTIFDYAYNLAALYYNKSLQVQPSSESTKAQQVAYNTILHKAEKALEKTLHLGNRPLKVIKALEDLYEKTNQKQKLEQLIGG